MKPIGPLMREHRLIERMVALLNNELQQLTRDKKIDAEFLMDAIDFIRWYADRTHHGKEEDILFRELARKQLAREHEKTMNELVSEHIFARRMTASLASARENYIKGNESALTDILKCLKELVAFYPAHIEKEDKHFFYPSLEYLNKPEQARMLEEFWEFDRKLIHEKYDSIVTHLEKERL